LTKPFDQLDPFERLAVLREMIVRLDGLVRDLRRSRDADALQVLAFEQRLAGIEAELMQIKRERGGETMEDLLQPDTPDRREGLQEPTFLEMLARRQGAMEALVRSQREEDK